MKVTKMKILAKNDSSPKSSNGNKATPPGKPSNGSAKTATADKEDGEAKSKRPRVRLQSTKEPKLWCRMYKDVLEKYGTPNDPWGNPMVPVVRTFGLTDEEKAARKAAKDAEKQAFDSMSDEQKLAFTKAKREERAKNRDAKKASERQALIDQLKKEIAEGKL